MIVRDVNGTIRNLGILKQLENPLLIVQDANSTLGIETLKFCSPNVRHETGTFKNHRVWISLSHSIPYIKDIRGSHLRFRDLEVKLQ